MSQCKVTPGCVFEIPADVFGACPKCVGFKTIAKIVNGKPDGTLITCDQCSGQGTVKLVDNKNAVHVGPCVLSADCRCDQSPAWATLAEQFHMCPVHNRRATPPGPLKVREDAMAAAAVAQKAVDDAAYAAKIDAAVVAKKWIDVPEPRRSIEIAKLPVEVAVVEEP